MSSLFIAGNGFDLAHGIHTNYSDFRTYIVSKYPEAEVLRDTIISFEDIIEIDSFEFASELLLHCMDKAAGNNWCDFENALAHINFSDKFPMPNHQENETEKEDNELMMNYMYYLDILTNTFIDSSKLWQDIFRCWLKDIQNSINEKKYERREGLVELINNNDMKFFSFNYTKTLQELYGVKKVVHIHNRVGQTLIFGHGIDSPSYDNSFSSSSSIWFGSSSLNDMLELLKKDTDRALQKNRYFFKSLDENIDKVYSYGFSYGKVDSIYLKKIIEKISPNTIWHFTEFESQDKKSIRIKKIKLRKYGFKGEFDTFNG